MTYTTINPSSGHVRYTGFPLRLPLSSTLTHAPLSFVRSGDIRLDGGHTWYVGERGYGWSRVTENTASTYFLSMNPTTVYLSGSAYRWGSFPLRKLHCSKKQHKTSLHVYQKAPPPSSMHP